LLIYSIKSQSYILFSQLSDIVILFLFLLVLVNDFQYTAGDIVIHTFKVHRITYFVHLDHPLLAVKKYVDLIVQDFFKSKHLR
jgi:hypothetical protein